MTGQPGWRGSRQGSWWTRGLGAEAPSLGSVSGHRAGLPTPRPLSGGLSLFFRRTEPAARLGPRGSWLLDGHSFVSVQPTGACRHCISRVALCCRPGSQEPFQDVADPRSSRGCRRGARPVRLCATWTSPSKAELGGSEWTRHPNVLLFVRPCSSRPLCASVSPCCHRERNFPHQVPMASLKRLRGGREDRR